MVDRLTKEQAVIVTGYTGITACPFSDFHGDVERRLGRPIWTHQFASKELWEEIKEGYRADFVALCHVAEQEGE